MSKSHLISVIGFLLLFISGPSQAQNQFSLGELLPGQILLNLSASEDMEVDQDRLTATLQFTAQGQDKAALQSEVNQAIGKALELLEDAEDVEFSTQQYHVYIYQPGRPARSDIANPVWRAQQSIQLLSNNSSELLDLAGELQGAGLHMVSLYYSVSPETHERVSDSLMSAALQKLQARADEAAASLNKSSADLIEVSVDGNRNFGYRPEALMARAAADSDALVDPPVASPGKTQVSVTVTARALLSP